MGRPRGEIAQALLQAALEPGTVRDLAARSRVGWRAAAYTATRLVARGDLVVLDAGRPAVLVAAEQSPAVLALAEVLRRWR